MRMSEIFREELIYISNADMRYTAEEFLDNIAPRYFFTVAASSTGKYHPWYSLGYGGLVRHTKAAVKIAIDLLSIEQNHHLPKDEIIVALLLHDTFKHGEIDSGRTVHIHPKLAADAIRQFATTMNESIQPKLELTASLVESHMGQWNAVPYSPVVLPKPTVDAAQFVHMCDYLASRKHIIVEVQ